MQCSKTDTCGLEGRAFELHHFSKHRADSSRLFVRLFAHSPKARRVPSHTTTAPTFTSRFAPTTGKGLERSRSVRSRAFRLGSGAAP